jgi:peptidoglycan/LPS O-acetylase OafA/YrhL
VGVDLFFVLSGFLITGILLDTRADHNRTKSFYLRRGLRIWPLYFVFLTAAWAGFSRMLPAEPHLWIYVLFAQNFFFFLGQGPFLDPTWSLAVEEQFYLLWPWVAFRVRRETIIKISGCVMLASPFVRWAAETRFGTDVASLNTLCRLDGLAMGGLLAAWIRTAEFDPKLLGRFARIAIAMGGAGALVSLAAREELIAARVLSHSFLAIAFGGTVALSLRQQANVKPFATFLRKDWLRWVGKVSFALYLFNYPIYVLAHGVRAQKLFAGWSPMAGSIGVLVLENGLLFIAAWLSWHVLESRMLKLKSRLAPRCTTSLAAEPLPTSLLPIPER